MATATVLAPSNHYAPQTSSYPTPAQRPISKMISSEPTKPGAAEQEGPRQSLPSISDVLKVAEPRQYASPASSVIPPSSSFPSPFTTASRGSYPDGDKHTSPQTLQHPAFTPRSEPPSTFAESSRSSFSNRPGIPPATDRRPSPPARHELPPHHHMSTTEPSKSHEPHHSLNGGYAHGPQPPPPPPQAGPYSHGPLPPGQVPLPGYPISPRHMGPPASHPYDPRAPPPHPDQEFANRERAHYDAPPRRFETWDYTDALARVRNDLIRHTTAMLTTCRSRTLPERSSILEKHTTD